MQLNRGIVKFVKKIKLKESNNDFNYWQTKSYEERLITLEEIRQEFNRLNYKNPQGFVRVYTITHLNRKNKS